MTNHKGKINTRSPIHLLLVIVVSTFTVELLLMFVFSLLPSFPVGLQALLDGLLLTVFSFPVLYFFSFRPMVQHLVFREQTEAVLQQANETLENRVQERTARLEQLNQDLQMKIAEHQRAEDEIQSLALFPKQNPNPVMRIAADRNLLYANDASQTWLAEEVGREQQDVLKILISASMEALLSGSNQELEVGSSEKVFSFVLSPIPEYGYVNLYGRDITQGKQLERQLRFDALHDSLTGLGNRTLLLDHLRHVNERKKRKPELIYTLFFLDFDRFKKVNDTLGHSAGDQLLVEAARRLEQHLRSSDTIARFTEPETITRIAGDEFVILLEDFGSTDDVYRVADRIVNLLSLPYNIDGMEVCLTASLGLVIPDQSYTDPEDIIRDADIAMYHAKHGSGNQVVSFSPEMYQKAIARMQLESDLRCAVERKEFTIYYQPIYYLETDQIAGFEALVRWDSPLRGLVMPSEFIPIAEEIGLIVPLGYFVLEAACRQMHIWQQQFLQSAGLVVSVNLSSRQIMSTDMVTQIRAILDRTEFDPKYLWLEITETTFIEISVPVWAALNDLRAMGIRIEIDDFGTGYSSLNYLRTLPIDGLKIDRSFIQDIQGGGQQIVKTLIELSHSLGLLTVAEGVETESQRDYLKSLTCDFAQGFLMAKPLSTAAVEMMLKSKGTFSLQCQGTTNNYHPISGQD